MIRIKLAELLGKRKMKVTDLAKETGLHPNTLYRLYHEGGTRVDLEVLETLFKYFGCSTEELFEYDPAYIREEK